jgi:hypothetical protein
VDVASVDEEEDVDEIVQLDVDEVVKQVDVDKVVEQVKMSGRACRTS